jgi:hypothetical protein
MWIRVLLQSWWVRTVYLALWCVAGAFGMIALFRYQDGISPDPFSLPVPGIVIIAVACVGLAGLLAAVFEQQRNRYHQVLQATTTPAERSQAIAAVWRGPVPDNPRVRDAAGQLAWLQLSGYRKNRKASWIIYPLVVVTWLLGGLDEWSEHDYRRAIVSAVFAGLFLVLFAWLVLARRRLEARVGLLAPVLISRQNGAATAR